MIGRTQVIGSTLGSFVILLTFISGGFVLSKASTHPWTVWLYWRAPAGPLLPEWSYAQPNHRIQSQQPDVPSAPSVPHTEQHAA